MSILALRALLLTIATIAVVASFKLNDVMQCSEEVEYGFMFGNACQDRLFGGQFILLAIGMVFIALAATVKTK